MNYIRNFECTVLMSHESCDKSTDDNYNLRVILIVVSDVMNMRGARALILLVWSACNVLSIVFLNTFP